VVKAGSLTTIGVVSHRRGGTHIL